MSRPIILPNAPVLVPGARHMVWIDPDGEVLEIDSSRAAALVRQQAPIVCHARSVARRLGIERFPCFDVLELFAFIRPASFTLPTPQGLAAAMGLLPPATQIEQATTLLSVVSELLAEQSVQDGDPGAVPIARVMHACSWPWAPHVLLAMGEEPGDPGGRVDTRGLEIWRRLVEWEESAPEPPSRSQPVEPEEAQRRLSDLLGGDAEPRDSQVDYTGVVAGAFTPRDVAGEPRLVLAEAGTGVGKTLGYIAPASVWAERNEGAVWISTYTRNLQHQIDSELDRLHPNPVEKATKVVIRKGRENYLCLLNLEEAARALPTMPKYGTALGLMARWAEATRDGDMMGGDFPAWLAHILGHGRTLGLADRRGECVYSACPHYHRCYIEKSVRTARRADIVVANHALVMIQAALGGVDDTHLPTRYVFDEGHHVFDAADSAFAAHLSGLETADLRRWLIGAEGRRSGRARGLRKRIEDLIADDEEALAELDAALDAARILPGEGWTIRISEGEPRGPAERFLHLVRGQVYARVDHPGSPYSLQCETRPVVDGVLDAADALDRALQRIEAPLESLRSRLVAKLDDEAEHLEGQTRLRVEAVARSLQRRATMTLGAWRSMLTALSNETPESFVDWFEVDRVGGRDDDVGMKRHWVDPTLPFSAAVLEQAHGVLITSATLRDGSGDEDQDWAAAANRTGARHLSSPAITSRVASPFDYARSTRVYVVGDVRKSEIDQVAAAYRELFLAAGGGAIGLFTAIQRLRDVHDRIAAPLEAAGLPLHAQHVDGMDLATLIDIFRAETNSCLLGTDAVRDGVDVPGRSLQLIVFDRVPWPRPDLLYRARREVFGKAAYTDMLTRLKIKQAFGRLIRRSSDRGVFVLLDPSMPSRLLGAFPDGVDVVRCGLAEAISGTREFLADTIKSDGPSVDR